MAYCYKCGKPLIDGDRFCTHCGTEQSYITGGRKHYQEKKHVPPIKFHPVRWINNLIIVQTIKSVNFWKIIGFFVLAALAIGGLLLAFHVFESNSATDAQEEEQIKSESNTINGHEYVDLGLSVKWATCNVGADRPEEYGDYFAWGETKPKKRYAWSNYFDCQNPENLDNDDSWSIYKLSGTTAISPEDGHDTARENWGGTWRMPTSEECYELTKECSWKWCSINGHEGFMVVGPNGNSIFLVAAGERDETDKLWGAEKMCTYWANNLSHCSSFANHLYIENFGTEGYQTSSSNRKNGNQIRPVTDGL